MVEGLLGGIAAALLYNYQGDEEAIKIQEAGIDAAIAEFTQLDRSAVLFDLIVKQYNTLKQNK